VSAPRRKVAAAALLAALLPALAALPAQAATYECRITDVWSPLVIPEREYLRRTAPTLRLEDTPQGAVVTRCARAPGEREAKCERVEIDWVAVHAAAGSRKYYRFETHYDLQLFFDRSFVENDGRGVVYHGQCRELKP
jgi:hypothetical protein